MQITGNRRSGMRIPATGEALVRAGEHAIRCPCVDLSKCGIGLLAPFAVATGESVELHMAVEGRPVELRARVARAKRSARGWLWGLCFDEESALAPAIERGHARLMWRRQAQPYLDRLGSTAHGRTPAAAGIYIAVPHELHEGSKPGAPDDAIPVVPVRTGLTEPQTLVVDRAPAPPPSAKPSGLLGAKARDSARKSPSLAAAERRFRAVCVDDLDLDDGPTTIYDGAGDDVPRRRTYVHVG